MTLNNVSHITCPTASGTKALKHPTQTNPPLHAVQNFLVTLINADVDGKIIINATKSKGAMPSITLKYQLLNPSRVFQEVVENARSVILVRSFVP